MTEEILSGKNNSEEIFLRTSYLLGDEGIEILKNSKVIIFGLGGVGSYCAEALVRAGVGFLCYVDADTVSLSNINRQLIALHSTVGKPKVSVAAQRAHDISPDTVIVEKNMFYLPENADSLDLSGYDMIVDAVDTVGAKLELAKRASELNIPIISCMGTGNRLHPELLRIDDIFNTDTCHLARVMRSELRKRKITKLCVVCSSEKPLSLKKSIPESELPEGKRTIPGSVSFVPATAGLLMASDVVLTLLNKGK